MSEERTNPTVDVHAHILLPALQQLVAEADPEGFGAQQALEVRRNGPESMAASGRMIKERWPQLTDLERRLTVEQRKNVTLARNARARGDKLRDAVNEQARQVRVMVLKLYHSGLSYREVGVLVGLSKSRVQDLVLRRS